MRKNPIALTIILIILVSLGYAVKHYLFPDVPPVQSPKTELNTIQPPSNNEVPRSVQQEKPVGSPAEKQVLEDMSIGQRRGLADEIVTSNDKSDLSNHSMSINRQEKKGFEFMPGVKVKSGAVHVQLDEENDKTLEIERHPRESNSDYQVMIKKKF